VVQNAQPSSEKQLKKNCKLRARYEAHQQTSLNSSLESNSSQKTNLPVEKTNHEVSSEQASS
jgi:hypothetical protein